MTQAQIDRKYGLGLAEYSLCDKGKFVDANYTTDVAARFANDSRGTSFPNNSEFCGSNYKYYLKSSKQIKLGEEIFTSYGPTYWWHK